MKRIGLLAVALACGALAPAALAQDKAFKAEADDKEQLGKFSGQPLWKLMLACGRDQQEYESKMFPLNTDEGMDYAAEGGTDDHPNYWIPTAISQLVADRKITEAAAKKFLQSQVMKVTPISNVEYDQCERMQLQAD